MKTTDSAPEEVNVLRRFLAVVVFMVGFPCVIVCMPWRRSQKTKDRCEKMYEAITKVVLKLNPNFDD